MLTQLYEYNLLTGEYTGSRDAQIRPNGEPVLLSGSATPTPPPEDIPPEHVICWNGTAWEILEDHRRVMDDRGRWMDGTGTPYWLPGEGDDWQSAPRYMETPGPLPEGAVTTRPEKPAAVDNEERTAAVKARLSALDAASARPLRALATGTGTDEDRAILQDLETRAVALRAEMDDQAV